MLEGSNSVGHFHDRWTRRRRVVGCEWICARRLSFSGAQRGSSGTARAPGLASASMTTRLGFRWNAGDLVREPSPHRCQWRRLEYMTLTSMSTGLTFSTIPLPSFLAAESLRIRPGAEEFAFPSSSSAMSTVRCLSAKKAVADHTSAVYSLVHTTRVFVDTGASQTEDPTALILGELVFSFFSPWSI